MPNNRQRTTTDKTRNLFHCVLSPKRMLVLDGDHNKWFDGDKLIIDERQFPVTEDAREAARLREEECRGPGYSLYEPAAHGWGELAEIWLPNGDHYRREESRGKLVCIAGPNTGEEFDDIHVHVETGDADGPYKDLAWMNVMGHDYSWYRAMLRADRERAEAGGE